MNRNYIKILVALFIISKGGIFAKETLNWKQVLDLAEKNNYTLKQAKLNLKQLELKMKIAFGNFYPTLSLNASVDKNYAKNYESDWIYSYGASLGVNLFSGFSRINTLKIQKLEWEIAKENYKRTYANVLYELKEKFVNLYYAQKLFELSQKIYERRKQNYELVKLKYESGSEDLGAFLRVEADLINAEYELNKAQRDKDVSLKQLFFTIGTQDVQDVEVEFSFETSSDIEDIIKKDEQKIIAQIPELKIKEYQLEKAKLQAKLSESNFYPTINFFANYNISDNKPIPDKDNWKVSLGFKSSLNLFNGFKNFNDLKIANIEIKTAEFELSDTKLSLLENFYMLKNSYINSKELLKVRQKYIDALQKQSDIVSLKYANGLATYYDWYQTEESFINSQKSLLSQKKELIYAEINLKKFLAILEE